MASGVQGMMDLTVPGGGSSVSTAVAGGADAPDESRDWGSMNRMLEEETPCHGLLVKEK